jgi:glycerol-3-phosphate dehydrogenase
VYGVRARDEIAGRDIKLRSRVVINATGPWVDEWIGERVGASLRPRCAPRFHASKAFNLVTRQVPFRDGLGLPVGASTYFIIPWNGRSLVGTRHLRCDHSLRSAVVTREEVTEFLDELNRVLGVHRLAASDVLGVFAGLLPEEEDNTAADVALERAPRIVDHSEDAVRGLLSIIGVKWTTARAVAERAVRVACRQLGKPEVGALRTLSVPVARVSERIGWAGLDPEARAHLDELYGPSQDAVRRLVSGDAELAARVVPDLPVMMGQVVHAAREEMAARLADVVMRRVPLYLSEALDRSGLSACAAVLARELRWSRRETITQIEQAEAQMAVFHGPLRASCKAVAAARCEPQTAHLS